MYTMHQQPQIVSASRAKYLVVRDKGKNPGELSFELNKKEYFTGLASLLEVLTEMLQKCYEQQRPPTAHHLELLHALQEELVFLQDTYRIVDKE